MVVKSTDESVNMSSEQVKDTVLKNVSKSLNVRVRAVRKTRSLGHRGGECKGCSVDQGL